MAQVKVTVGNMGVYEINSDFVSELMTWLSTHRGISITEDSSIREINNNQFTGRELITE